MIWLRDKEVLTCNAVVGDIDRIKILRRELYDKKKYILLWTKLCKGDIVLPEEFDAVNYFVNEQVKYETNTLPSNMYTRKCYTNPKAQSLMYLDIALDPVDFQKSSNINLMNFFGCDANQIDEIETIYESTNNEEFQRIMEECWEDYYYFATQVLDVTSFETVHEYNVEELKWLKENSHKHHIPNSVREIIQQIPLAGDNSRVLKLATTICNKK